MPGGKERVACSQGTLGWKVLLPGAGRGPGTPLPQPGMIPGANTLGFSLRKPPSLPTQDLESLGVDKSPSCWQSQRELKVPGPPPGGKEQRSWWAISCLFFSCLPPSLPPLCLSPLQPFLFSSTHPFLLPRPFMFFYSLSETCPPPAPNAFVFPCFITTQEPCPHRARTESNHASQLAMKPGGAREGDDDGIKAGSPSLLLPEGACLLHPITTHEELNPLIL